jgi:ABC-2 type transport system ATP-binding protein
MHVTIFGDHAAFRERVSAAGHSVEWHEETGSLRVEGIEPNQTDRLWAWAAETGTAIRRLEPAVNSLEQIFIDVAAGSTPFGVEQRQALTESVEGYRARS